MIRSWGISRRDLSGGWDETDRRSRGISRMRIRRGDRYPWSGIRMHSCRGRRERSPHCPSRQRHPIIIHRRRVRILRARHREPEPPLRGRGTDCTRSARILLAEDTHRRAEGTCEAGCECRLGSNAGKGRLRCKMRGRRRGRGMRRIRIPKLILPIIILVHQYRLRSPSMYRCPHDHPRRL